VLSVCCLAQLPFLSSQLLALRCKLLFMGLALRRQLSFV
jgi:hypothetical protein